MSLPNVWLELGELKLRTALGLLGRVDSSGCFGCVVFVVLRDRIINFFDLEQCQRAVT